MDLSVLDNISTAFFFNYAFADNASLKSVDISALTTISNYWCFYYTFMNCTSLEKVDFSSLETIAYQGTDGMFYGCTSLEAIEFPVLTTWNATIKMFYNCTSLKSLTMGADEVCTFTRGTDVFYNTPIADGTGYIYVPEDLVDEYKTATNWSTYADQIVAIGTEV